MSDSGTLCGVGNDERCLLIYAVVTCVRRVLSYVPTLYGDPMRMPCEELLEFAA